MDLKTFNLDLVGIQSKIDFVTIWITVQSKKPQSKAPIGEALTLKTLARIGLVSIAQTPKENSRQYKEGSTEERVRNDGTIHLRTSTSCVLVTKEIWFLLGFRSCRSFNREFAQIPAFGLAAM